MYITYKHKGTTYQVASCRNCKASMTMTTHQFHKLHDRPTTDCLVLFDYLECCDKSIFYWEADWS